MPCSSHFKSLAKLSSTLLLCLLLAGCGTRFVYNNLDWLAYWYIDDYVELNPPQKRYLDQLLQQWLLWHRQEQLPVYLAQLNSLKQQLQGDLDEQQLLSQAEAWSEHYSVLMQRLLDDVLPMAEQANPEQALQIVNQVKQDYRYEPDEEEYYAYRTKQLRKGVKRHLGRVNPAQQRLIEEYALQFKDLRQPWLELNQQWLQQFSYTMMRYQNQDLLKANLQLLLVEPRSLWSEQLRADIQHNRGLWAELMVKLWREASPKQKQRLLAKLDSYIEDLAILISQAEPQAA